jgi:hypothetical protein
LCIECSSYIEFRTISLILFSRSSHLSRYPIRAAPLIKPTAAQFVTFPRSLDAVRTLLKLQQPQTAAIHSIMRQELNAFKNRK